MTDKIKENAIKISKIIDAPAGAFVNSSKFEEYKGLMPIVFECRMDTNSKYDIELRDESVQYRPDVYFYNTEPEFIIALQECIIKYLEVRNG